MIDGNTRDHYGHFLVDRDLFFFFFLASPNGRTTNKIVRLRPNEYRVHGD